jgi:transposase
LACRVAPVEPGRPIRYYATAACRAWASKARCPRHQEGRRVTRGAHEHILERRPKRVEANPALMKRRKQLVAHPCGTIKRWHDRGYVLRQGREKVPAGLSLSTLADNLRRAVTILGGPYLVRALA